MKDRLINLYLFLKKIQKPIEKPVTISIKKPTFKDILYYKKFYEQKEDFLIQEATFRKYNISYLIAKKVAEFLIGYITVEFLKTLCIGVPPARTEARDYSREERAVILIMIDIQAIIIAGFGKMTYRILEFILKKLKLTDEEIEKYEKESERLKTLHKKRN